MNTEHEELMYGKFFNELNDEELKKFDQLLTNDEDFRKEFEILSPILHNLTDDKSKLLRNKLNSIYLEMYSTKKENKMMQLLKQNWYPVAAAIAVLLMVGAFWFSGLNQKGWNDKIYQNYYEEDEVFMNTRSKANFDVDVLHSGMELLEKKEFSAALAEFNKLPNSITANYYSGVANMELSNHELAIYKFNYVIDDYLNLFYDQAQWYKGLCLVKLEKKNEAIDLFDRISHSESYFKDKARLIIADLKKN